VAAYSFNQAVGTIAADSSGNNNTGTLVGPPTWSTGKYASALSFDGISNYVDLGNSTTLQTFCVRIYIANSRHQRRQT
jgi:hypothetical protein